MNIVMVDQMDRGLAYGEACFETFRVIDGHVFAWSAHMQRLESGLAMFGLNLSELQMESVYRACLAAAAKSGDDALLRLTVSGGQSDWGLFRHGRDIGIYVQTVPIREKVRQPKSLLLLDWPFPPKPRPAKFTSDYGETLRVLKDIAHADVLFVHNGLLLGSATANVLLYREQHWWSPDGDGILPGVVRDFLVTKGVVHLAKCPLDWLDDAEAVMLSNSGSFLQAVSSITSDSVGERFFDSQHSAMGRLIDALQNQPGMPAGGLD